MNKYLCDFAFGLNLDCLETFVAESCKVKTCLLHFAIVYTSEEIRCVFDDI